VPEGYRKEIRLTALLAVFVFSLTFSLYLNAINNAFQFDDVHSIVENFSLRRVTNIPRFYTDPASFSSERYMAMYRPLLLTTYAINYYFGGMDVKGFHIANNLIHALNALLLFLIAARLMRRRPVRAGPEKKNRSDGDHGAAITSPHWILPITAALLFGLHPLNTQAVNYISSRSVLLVTLFYLLSFYLYLVAGSARGDKRSLYLYAGSVVCFGLALLSKEIGITLPAIIATYVLLERHGNIRDRIRSLPKCYLAMLATTGAVYLIIRKVVLGNAVITISKATLLDGAGGQRSLLANFLTQVKVDVIYLKMFIFPSNLSIDKDIHVVKSVGDPHFLLSLLAIIVMIVVSILLIKRNSRLAFGVVWFFVAIIPVTVLPLNILYNEHRTYLPMAGLCLAVGSGLSWVATLFDRETTARGGKIALIVALSMILGASAALTIKRNRVWKSPISFWSDVLTKTPSSYIAGRAHVEIGSALMMAGDYGGALASYKEAIAIAPMEGAPYLNMGVALTYLNMSREAIGYMERAVELDPRIYKAYNSIAIRYVMLGEYDRALEYIEKGLAVNPGYPYYYNTLGNILGDGFGRREEAKEAYRKAIKLAPDWDLPRKNLEKSWMVQPDPGLQGRQ
jgi:tetratricopeptide (TPR) repeat protein